MRTNQTNPATQALAPLAPTRLLSVQISVVGMTLGTIGFLATVTAYQAAALRGPVPLGGFTMTQVAGAVSAAAILGYLLAGHVILGIARRRITTRPSESSTRQGGILLALHNACTLVSVSLLNVVVGVCGAAYLVENDVVGLGMASAATLLAICHFPRPGRVSVWIDRQLRQIDEERQVRRLTANA